MTQYESGERVREYYRKQGAALERTNLINILNNAICEERREYGTSCGHTYCYRYEELVYELEQKNNK